MTDKQYSGKLSVAHADQKSFSKPAEAEVIVEPVVFVEVQKVNAPPPEVEVDVIPIQAVQPVQAEVKP